jgi:hypothetical protein
LAGVWSIGEVKKITEYGVQSTEEPGHKKVGAWLRRALFMVRRARSISPLPAGGARERWLGWYAVPTLPEAGPTLPGGSFKRGTGDR